MEKDFLHMINVHRGIIYKVCHLYGTDREYREDLFQEIVLQLWKSFPGFRNESLQSTWMYRVALNTAISDFRKVKRSIEKRSILPHDLQFPDMEGQNESENLGTLRYAIQKLTQVEKAVILLYLDDKKYDEISEITGLSKSNVGVKISRIKLKLEDIIKNIKP